MWGQKDPRPEGNRFCLLRNAKIHKNHGVYVIAWGCSNSQMLNPSSHCNVPASIGVIPKIFDGVFSRVGFGPPRIAPWLGAGDQIFVPVNR